ncbi:hypothetical protein PHYBOEH_003836 [Phytophthora boehmeriae]|uniref:Uncharacterized protein n=1 Tax=Phytophthora boehmeriae TaxID=109152 RepID=A0A8T1X4N4_9STRA|nr:hypothetical protein PHYBOEH_003836 [Phytophthora boehmeriae]
MRQDGALFFFFFSCAVLLLTDVAGGRASGQLLTQDGPMPAPARAHCRVFVVASQSDTRLLVLQNAYEQDVIDVYDHQEALESVLIPSTTAAADAAEEKKTADAAYKTLRPAVDQAAEWLTPRVDPRHCYAHFVSAHTEVAAATGEMTKDEAKHLVTSRVTRRLDQLRDRARRDSSFPFVQAEPSLEHRDGESVTAGGDLQLVTPTWRRYFQVVGTNYFAGRVAPSLSPGQIEVFGLLHVDAGGQLDDMEVEMDSTEMVFDVRERWRRSKRQRQVSVALNTSDFYGRGYVGFGRQGIKRSTVKLLQEQVTGDAKADTLQHPCFLRDNTMVVGGGNLTLNGAGDADKCMTLIRAYVASSNVNCPPENFCVLDGAPQPQPFSSFYTSGVLREAVLSTSRILGQMHQMEGGESVPQLQLPTPPLTALRDAAKTVCSLPYSQIVASTNAAQGSPAKSSSLDSTVENEVEAPSVLCLDLCYTVVLLEKVGVQDADERVYFVEKFEKQPVLSNREVMSDKKGGTPPELVAWLTGAFLYLEALQRKVTFSIESELLAEQLNAGLPLGWNMSLLVFVAACCFLYFTTGRVAIAGRAGRGTSGYHRVVNGGAKAKYKDTTQSIIFVDDARE